MSIGLAVSSGASGLLLGCLLFGALPGQEPAALSTTFAGSTTGFLGARVASTTAQVILEEAPRRGGSIGEFELRTLIGSLLAAFAVFACGYGCGSWGAAPRRRRERVRARILDGAALARGAHRGTLSGRPELRAREDPRVAGERLSLADLDSPRS